LRRWLWACGQRKSVVQAAPKAQHHVHKRGQARRRARRAQARVLKRQLALPVATMSQRWVSRSSSAVVILASPKTEGHSPKPRLVVTITEGCSPCGAAGTPHPSSELADQVEQQLPAGLGEGQIAELVRCGRGDPAAPLKEDHEVEAAEMVGEPALAAGAGLAVEPVDQVDNVVEAAAGAAVRPGLVLALLNPSFKVSRSSVATTVAIHLRTSARSNDDAENGAKWLREMSTSARWE
jgi:hypothetical protein